MNRSHIGMALLCSVIGAAHASDAYRNPTMRLHFPDGDLYFQDGRSLREIITRRLPERECDMGDPLEPAPIIACFDPDSPPSPEMMAAVDRAMRGYQNRFWVGTPWFGRGANTPLSLTWSFVPDGLTVGAGGPGGAGPSELFSRMDTLFGAANRQVWISKFQQCFDRFSAISGITYTRIRNGTNEWDDGAAWGTGGGGGRGDVRIAMKTIDGAGGILAYNSFPDNGDMVLDRADSWNSSSNDYRWLRNIVMHEHGHGLGIAHVCPISQTKLMEPTASSSFDGLQQDDIRAVHYQNGDAYEPNNTVSTAAPAGAFSSATTITIGTVPSPAPVNSAITSIVGTDQDWFSFTLDRPRLFNITLTPIGSTYNDWQQAGDGTCNGSGSTNSLAVGNLAFDIRSASGTIIYRSVNDTAAGVTETTTNFLISPAGTFIVRVYGSGSVPETQLYRLSVQSLATTFSVSATDGTFTDKVRVTWPNNIADANGFQVMRSPTTSTAQATTLATLAGGIFQYDDTTAIPGTTYHYWVKARQPGNDTVYKYTTINGDPGFRAGANVPPIANAGPDQTVPDTDGNGVEAVSLDGSASTDPDGTIVSYQWTKDGITISNGASAMQGAVLAIGDHTITLTVTDNLGATGSDTVLISVTSGLPCPADFDQSGGVDGGDVEAFFVAWEAGDESADVDQSGGIDGGDVETFFRAWEAGGC